MKSTLLFLLLSLGFWHSWKTEPESAMPSPAKPAAPPEDTIGYEAQILPILKKKCTPCHFRGGKMYDEMPFDQVETFLDNAEGILPRINTGPEGRLLRAFVKQSGGDKTLPPYVRRKK